MTARRGVGVADPGSRRRMHVQPFWVVIAAVLAGAVGMVVLSALMAPERQHDIWVEMAKSSAQIVVLVLSTGVVAAMLRDRDALREEQRRRRESLVASFEQLEVTYDQVKTARRLLRTFGFDSPATMTLTAEQATGFRVQMALLNEAELTFERHARKVAAMPGFWGAECTPLTTELTSLYQYLHGVLMEWQTDPTVFVAGGNTAEMQGWQHFRRFVGYDEASVKSFDVGVADRMLTIELLIRAAEKPATRPLLRRHHEDTSADH